MTHSAVAYISHWLHREWHWWKLGHVKLLSTLGQRCPMLLLFSVMEIRK